MGQRRRRTRREGGRRLLSTAPVRTIDLSTAEELCTEPGALERVRRAFARLGPGDRLEVRATVAEHAFAVRTWARKSAVHIVADGPGEDGATLLVLEAASPGA
jgi:hypothetical protein